MALLPLFEKPAEEIRSDIERDIRRLSRYAPNDVTASRHRGSEESELAHERIEPHKTEMQGRVLDFLRAVGRTGATTDEVSRAVGMAYTSASARMSELKADGRAVLTDRRRKTTWGSPAAVVVAREFA
jgi:hypothetical protein